MQGKDLGLAKGDVTATQSQGTLWLTTQGVLEVEWPVGIILLGQNGWIFKPSLMWVPSLLNKCGEDVTLGYVKPLLTPSQKWTERAEASANSTPCSWKQGLP